MHLGWVINVIVIISLLSKSIFCIILYKESQQRLTKIALMRENKHQRPYLNDVRMEQKLGLLNMLLLSLSLFGYIGCALIRSQTQCFFFLFFLNFIVGGKGIKTLDISIVNTKSTQTRVFTM